jgi:hypothetical protein
MFNYHPFLSYSSSSLSSSTNTPDMINSVVLRGKIYKICPIDESNPTNLNDIYISSTILSLKEEMELQIDNYYRTFKKIRFESEGVFSKYGVDNCQIVLIEDFKCNSMEALRKREGEVMRKIKGIKL